MSRPTATEKTVEARAIDSFLPCGGFAIGGYPRELSPSITVELCEGRIRVVESSSGDVVSDGRVLNAKLAQSRFERALLRADVAIELEDGTALKLWLPAEDKARFETAFQGFAVAEEETDAETNHSDRQQCMVGIASYLRQLFIQEGIEGAIEVDRGFSAFDYGVSVNVTADDFDISDRLSTLVDDDESSIAKMVSASNRTICRQLIASLFRCARQGMPDWATVSCGYDIGFYPGMMTITRLSFGVRVSASVESLLAADARHGPTSASSGLGKPADELENSSAAAAPSSYFF